MANTNEVLGIDIVVNTDKAESTMNEFRNKTEDERRKMKKTMTHTMSLDVSELNAKRDLAMISLKKAIKDGNKNAKITIRSNIQQLNTQLSVARSNLNKFIKTGEKTQVISKIFNDTSNSIDKTQYHLLKIGKDTSGFVKIRKKILELKQELDSGKISADKFAKEMGDIDAQMKKMSGGGFLGRLKGLLWGMTGKIGAAVGGFTLGKSILGLGAGLEQAKISFEVMLGSAERADKMLRDLSNFAKKTPFELTGIRDTAKQLMAMGVSADDMIPTMKALGDVSAGLNVPIERLALNYGQVLTQGKLTGREMKDFMVAGVPLADELANMLGKNKEQIDGMISAGEIGFPIVEEAFRRMTSEGGILANMMEAQSGTIVGMWSNFKDELANLGEKIGTVVIPPIKFLIESLNNLFNFFGSTAGKITLFTLALLSGVGILGAFSTGLLTFASAQGVVAIASGVLSTAFGFLTVATGLLTAGLTTLWVAAAPIIAIIGVAVAAVVALKYSFDSLGKSLQRVGEIFNIGPIKKFGEAISWVGEKLGQLGGLIADITSATWGWITGSKEATESTEELTEAQKKAAEAEKKRTEEVKELTKAQQELAELQDSFTQQMGEAELMASNLISTVANLEAEQIKLREEYANGNMTLEEFREKMGEIETKLYDARQASDVYQQGLSLVNNDQLTYIEMVQRMNNLRLNTSAYDALISKLKAVANQALTTLKVKAEVLDQAIKIDAVGVGTNLITGKYGALARGIDTISGGALSNSKAGKIFQKGQNMVRSAMQNEATKTKNEIKKLSKEIEEATELALKGGSGGGGSIGGTAKKSGGSSRKRGGGSGSSRAKKQANDARKAEEKRLKEAEKLEKKLAKTRTNSYKEAHKRAEKFADIIEETNKQLTEQRKKFEDLKKQALETIQDIDEKLGNEKSSYQEKIAKRYKDIIQGIRDGLTEGSIFYSLSDESLLRAFDEGRISDGNSDGYRKELAIIREMMNEEEIKLARKKEERSETEKITEEYKKQVNLLERNKAVQQAKIDGRFLTNVETGETQFFDKEGKIIEGADRNQQKDFKTQGKELQDIANEELKINKEKMDKIDSLYREFADERNRLNKNYFEEDKNMRINQENMIQTFFLNEIKRMAQQTQAAKQLTQALIALRSAGGSPGSVVTNNYNNSTNTVQNSRNNISVKTVADLKTIDKALGKRVSTRI